MSTPHITTLPASIREDAAREAEKVVQFDEGDFTREVDAVTEVVATFYIEQGARLAIEAFDLHFRDEDHNLTVGERIDGGLGWRMITDDDMESYAGSALADVLSEATRVRSVSA